MRKTMAAIGTSVFFVLAPGTVAGLIPWLLTGWQVRRPLPAWWAFQAMGVVLGAAALAVVVQAFMRFVVEGSGTPAPVAPPDQLVVGGLYRYVRNPMYLSVAAIVLGEALILGQAVLVAFAAVMILISAAFVHWYEEPVLARRFGATYDAYRRAVPGWWPRLRPWTPGEVGALRDG